MLCSKSTSTPPPPHTPHPSRTRPQVFDCQRTPRFGPAVQIKGKRKFLWCSFHKEDDAIGYAAPHALCAFPGCSLNATVGRRGGRADRCVGHSRDDDCYFGGVRHGQLVDRDRGKAFKNAVYKATLLAEKYCLEHDMDVDDVPASRIISGVNDEIILQNRILDAMNGDGEAAAFTASSDTGDRGGVAAAALAAQAVASPDDTSDDSSDWSASSSSSRRKRTAPVGLDGWDQPAAKRTKAEVSLRLDLEAIAECSQAMAASTRVPDRPAAVPSSPPILPGATIDLDDFDSSSSSGGGGGGGGGLSSGGRSGSGGGRRSGSGGGSRSGSGGGRISSRSNSRGGSSTSNRGASGSDYEGNNSRGRRNRNRQPTSFGSAVVANPLPAIDVEAVRSAMRKMGSSALNDRPSAMLGVIDPKTEEALVAARLCVSRSLSWAMASQQARTINQVRHLAALAATLLDVPLDGGGGSEGDRGGDEREESGVGFEVVLERSSSGSLSSVSADGV